MKAKFNKDIINEQQSLILIIIISNFVKVFRNILQLEKCSFKVIMFQFFIFCISFVRLGNTCHLFKTIGIACIVRESTPVDNSTVAGYTQQIKSEK